ncbi:MAG: translocation/assembly module TamB [Magnetococcales bacterium]|nr:translocation/assembly module TamB [Magnetococcales bacterium]
MDNPPPPDTPSPAPPCKPRRGRGLVWLTAGLVVPLLLALAISLDGVRRLAFAQLENALVRMESPLRVRGLEWEWPLVVRVAELSLRDEQGIWLAIGQGALTLSWRELLQGRIVIPSLSVRRIAVARLPESPSSPQPVAIPPFVLERALVERLDLGRHGAWHISGDLTREADGVLVAQAGLTRLDQEGTTAKVAATLTPAGERLRLEADLHDGTGLLADLLENPRLAGIGGTLLGDGPLSEWTGQATLQGPEIPAARIDLSVNWPRLRQGELQATLAGDLHLPPPFAGEAHVTAGLTGSLATPAARITLEGRELAMERHRLAGVRLGVELLPAPDGKTPWPAGVTVRGDLQAESLTLDPAPAGWSAWQPRVAFVARHGDAGHWLVESLTLENDREAILAAKGELHPATLTGRFQATGEIPRLAALARGLPWPLQGKAEWRMEGEVAAPSALTFTAVLRGHGIEGLPPEAAPLGREPVVQMRGVLHPDRLAASMLEVTGKDVTLLGDLDLDWVKETLRTRATLQLPAPAIEVRLEATGSALATTPAGTLALEAFLPAGQLTASSRYRILDFHQAFLDDLQLQGPRTRLAGNLMADWRQGRIQGVLTGGSEDLAALKPWHGLDLRGRADGELTVETPQGGKPQGRLIVKANDLAGAFGRIGKARLDARAGLPLERSRLEARLTLDQWHHPQARLHTLEAVVNGPLTRLEWTLDGKGEAGWPITASASGQLASQARQVRLNLASLTGTLAKEKLRLQKPFAILLADNQVQVDPMEWRLGDVALQASLTSRGRQVEGQLSGQGDLAILQRLGLPPMRGATRLDATVRGLVSQPDVTFSLALKKGQPLAPTLKHLPPVDLTLTGTVREGRGLRVDLVSQGLTQGRLIGHAEWPLRFAVRPWVLEQAQGEPIQATLQGQARLSDVGKWLHWEENQRLEGVVAMEWRAGGTVDRPLIEGGMTLEKGLFEQADAGTMLHDIRMRIKGEGETLVLESLTATDGEKGHLGATGRLTLDWERRLPFVLDLEMNRAVLVRRDDALAVVTGDARAAGTLEHVRVSGDLLVDRAEFNIPAAGRGDITLVETDDPASPSTAPASAPSSLPGSALDLTLHMPARVFIRGRGLESEWQGDLRVTGTLSEPLVAGRLQVKRGQLDLLDRRFVLNTGVVSFAGDWPPLPVVELEASVQRAALLTRIGLQGVATHPRVTLSSEPVLSEEEILSQLLFDRATDSITPGQALKLAMTLKNLQGGGSGIIGSVKRELGIDRLEVGGTSVETGTVSAGKYLTDEIYLEVEKGLKADSGRINVEVEMTPSLFLKTGVDAKSNADVGVQWKKDY